MELEVLLEVMDVVWKPRDDHCSWLSHHIQIVLGFNGVGDFGGEIPLDVYEFEGDFVKVVHKLVEYLVEFAGTV